MYALVHLRGHIPSTLTAKRYFAISPSLLRGYKVEERTGVRDWDAGRIPHTTHRSVRSTECTLASIIPKWGRLGQGRRKKK